MTSLTGQLNTDFDLYLYPPGSTDLSSSPVATSAGGAYPEKFKYVVPPAIGRHVLPAGGFHRRLVRRHLRADLQHRPGRRHAADHDRCLSARPSPTGTTAGTRPPPRSPWPRTKRASPTSSGRRPGVAGGGPTPAPSTPMRATTPSTTTPSISPKTRRRSKIRWVKLDMSAPSAPTLLSASGDNSTVPVVTLSWAASSDRVSGISGYRVYDGDSGRPSGQHQCRLVPAHRRHAGCPEEILRDRRGQCRP